MRDYQIHLPQLYLTLLLYKIRKLDSYWFYMLGFVKKRIKNRICLQMVTKIVWVSLITYGPVPKISTLVCCMCMYVKDLHVLKCVQRLLCAKYIYIYPEEQFLIVLPKKGFVF